MLEALASPCGPRSASTSAAVFAVGVDAKAGLVLFVLPRPWPRLDVVMLVVPALRHNAATAAVAAAAASVAGVMVVVVLAMSFVEVTAVGAVASAAAGQKLNTAA